eukprot:m.311541 g.311541  ORF g.311541 m.311541 type:complete len:282 (+) comp77392_c0_seq1:100-945(+)
MLPVSRISAKRWGGARVTRLRQFNRFKKHRYGVLSADWQKKRGMELIGVLEVRPGQSVLDLGCASGELTHKLGSYVGVKGRVVGIDPDKGRIESARSKFGDAINMEFCQGTSDDAITFGPFDRIFANFVLNWISDHALAFSQLFESLKPNGRFGFLLSRSPPDILHTLTSLATGQDLNRTVGWTFRSADEWLDLCLKTGFCNVKVDEYVAYNCHPSLDHLLRWWDETTSRRFAVKFSQLEGQALDCIVRELGLEGKEEPVKFAENIVRVIAEKPSRTTDFA